MTFSATMDINNPQVGSYWESTRTIKHEDHKIRRWLNKTLVQRGDFVKIISEDIYYSTKRLVMVADGPCAGHQVTMHIGNLKPVTPLKWLAFQAQ